MEWWDDGILKWLNDGMMELQNDGRIEWSNDWTMEWWIDEIMTWWNDDDDDDDEGEYVNGMALWQFWLPLAYWSVCLVLRIRVWCGKFISGNSSTEF